jgi:hypothetical protein
MKEKVKPKSKTPYATICVYGGFYQDVDNDYIRMNDYPVDISGEIDTRITENGKHIDFKHTETYPKVFISAKEDTYFIDLGYNMRIECNGAYLDALHDSIPKKQTFLQYEEYLKKNFIGTNYQYAYSNKNESTYEKKEN